MDPCRLCGRTPKRVIQQASLEARRGQDRFCDVPRCPLMDRWTGLIPQDQLSGRSAYGPSPPSLFVGRYGYPDVRLGPLMTPGKVEDASLLDQPPSWTRMELGDVLAMRSGLIRGNATVKVDDAQNLHDPTHAMDVTQELAMATKPAYTELTFNKDVDLTFKPILAGSAAPTGPNVRLERAELTENPRVPKRVDQVVSDTDARAKTGAWELYERGVDGYQVQRLLSAGLLGHARDRRFVPTRWSITATDDMLSKGLIDDLRDHQQIGDFRVYSSLVHGNRFYVLFLPGPWSFEMVEAWLVPEPTPEGEPPRRRVKVLQDHEGVDGRSGYADEITGAYYAARLAVAERLTKDRRQARVVVLREITDDYYAPAGVWVIREGVREAMRSEPREPASLKEALGFLDRVSVFDVAWQEASMLVDDHLHQARLDAF